MIDSLLHHTLRSAAERYPEQEALVDGPRRLSFQEVACHVGSASRNLRESIPRNGRVGVFLGPCVEQALSLYAISSAGGVFVPIHKSLFPNQVVHIATDCQMSVLITDAEKLQRLRPYLGEMPSLKNVIVVETGNAKRERIDVDEVLVSSFSELQDGELPSGWADQQISRDLAAIIYTSGSTGLPKGVMLSHANLLAGAKIVSEYLNISSRDRILAALPFSFDAGLNQLTCAFLQASTLVMTDFLFGRDIVRELVTENITGLAGVPSLWSLLVQPSSQLGKRPLPHLRFVTNTGGRLPMHVLQSLRATLPATDVYLMYGLTEAFRSTYLSPSEIDNRPTSIGKAIPDTEILVINEHGERCKPGEVGELVHRGPTVSLGYWGPPEWNAKVFRPHPFPINAQYSDESVVYSGDLVREDAEGFLYFEGRRDQQIKSAGFRVSPTEIEEVLCRHPAVHHAAVVGVPDDVLGHRIVAFVVADEGNELQSKSVLDFCAQNLPRHMNPKAITIVTRLPATSSGKVDYHALRQQAGLSTQQE